MGSNRGESKKKIDKILSFLVNEGLVAKKMSRYIVTQKANWKIL